MDWANVINNPYLRNLPFKIELNRWGKILNKYRFETPYKKAPEICVKITSPSNSKDESEEKIQLYLARGAIEVWVVNEDGDTSFYSYEGQIPNSVEVQG